MNRFLYALTLGLLGAVIVHICVLLLVPYYTQYNIWPRLQGNAPLFAFHDLPADDLVAKTSDPLFKVKVCSFNLEDVPVNITAEGQVPFWSLSLYDTSGTKLYSLNDRTSPNGALDIVVGDPVQIMDLKQTMAGDETDSILIPQNIDNGFALLRVSNPSQDWSKEIDAFLNSASCNQIDY